MVVVHGDLMKLRSKLLSLLLLLVIAPQWGLSEPRPQSPEQAMPGSPPHCTTKSDCPPPVAKSGQSAECLWFDCISGTCEYSVRTGSSLGYTISPPDDPLTCYTAPAVCNEQGQAVPSTDSSTFTAAREGLTCIPAQTNTNECKRTVCRSKECVLENADNEVCTDTSVAVGECQTRGCRSGSCIAVPDPRRQNFSCTNPATGKTSDTIDCRTTDYACALDGTCAPQPSRLADGVQCASNPDAFSVTNVPQSFKELWASRATPPAYTCTIDCLLEWCGDGKISGREECDGSARAAGVGSDALCNPETCTVTYGATISFAPARMMYGQLLGDRQLNASVATVSGGALTDGSISYQSSTVAPYQHGTQPNAGSHPVTATWEPSASLAGKYSTLSTLGTLVVDPKPITCTARSYTKKQGESNPSFEFDCPGLVPGDSQDQLGGRAGLASGENGSAAGTYEIVFLDNPRSPNYAITLVPGRLTVQPVATITFAPAAMIYGQRLGADQLNATVKDAFTSVTLEGTITYTSAAVNPYQYGTRPNAGDHPVTASWSPAESLGGKYQSLSTDAVLRVAPKPITCTANSFEKRASEPNPEFTFTCDGLEPGDTLQALNGAVGLEATATPQQAGTYQIIFTSLPRSSNYTITTRNGTLRVTSDSVDCSALVSTFTRIENSSSSTQDSIYTFTSSETKTLTIPIYLERGSDDATKDYPGVDVKLRHIVNGSYNPIAQLSLPGTRYNDPTPSPTVSLGSTQALSVSKEDLFYYWVIPNLPPGQYDLVFGRTVIQFINDRSNAGEEASQGWAIAYLQCFAAFCGDGMRNGTEQCDGSSLPPDAAPGSTCSTSCTLNGALLAEPGDCTLEPEGSTAVSVFCSVGSTLTWCEGKYNPDGQSAPCLEIGDSTRTVLDRVMTTAGKACLGITGGDTGYIGGRNVTITSTEQDLSGIGSGYGTVTFRCLRKSQ